MELEDMSGAGIDSADFELKPTSPTLIEEQDTTKVDSTMTDGAGVGGEDDPSQDNSEASEAVAEESSEDTNDPDSNENSSEASEDGQNQKEEAVKENVDDDKNPTAGAGESSSKGEQQDATPMQTISKSEQDKDEQDKKDEKGDGVIQASPINGEKDFAKVVPNLSFNAKPFVGSVSSDSSKPAATTVEFDDPNRIDEDSEDPKVKELYEKIAKAQGEMKSDKNWIDKVIAIIGSYREKVSRVQDALRQKAIQVYEMKADLRDRHHVLRKEHLKGKLKVVKGSLSQLESTTKDISTRASSLVAVKENLYNNIRSLRSQIYALKSKKYHM